MAFTENKILNRTSYTDKENTWEKKDNTKQNATPGTVTLDSSSTYNGLAILTEIAGAPADQTSATAATSATASNNDFVEIYCNSKPETKSTP